MNNKSNLEIKKQIGIALREARVNKNITISELSYKSNISYNTIISWERAERCPDVEQFKKMIKCLEVKSNEIFKNINFTTKIPDELREYQSDTFGVKLNLVCKNKKISKTELSKIIKTSRQSILSWESEKTSPSMVYIIRLCEYFNTSLNFFCFECEESNENTNNKKKFAERLRSMRINENKTQMELDDAIGLTRCSINRWENGKSFPSYKMLEKLATYFNIPISDLTE